MAESLYEVKTSPAKEDIILNDPVGTITQVETNEIKLFDDGDDDQTLGWLSSRFDEMDSSRPDQDWDLRHQQYEALLSWNGDGTANVNLPIEQATIRNKMADALSQRPNIKFKPTEPSDVNKVNLTSKVWDFVWTEGDTDKELFDLFLGAYIYGSYPWYEYLHTEIFTRYVPIYNKDGSIGQKKETQKKSWLKGRAWDIRDVWLDPVHDIESAKDCFIRERDISYDNLNNLKNDPNYKNIDEALLNPDNASIPEPFSTSEEQRNGEMTPKHYTKMSYYNKEKGVLIETINWKVIIRETANPYPHGELPVSFLTDHKRLHELYGRGECEMLENTKYERNVTRNQITDGVRASNTYALAVGGGASFEGADMVNGIAQIWNFDGDLGGAQYLKPPGMDGGLFNLDGIQQNDATWITGIDNNSLAGSATKTAFEARLQEVTKLKGVGISLKLADYFYVRMARQRLANIQFFLPMTTGKKIIGEKKMRTIALEGISKDIVGVGKDGRPEKVGVEFEDSDGKFAFLQLDPTMIQSNLDISVETPSTTPILRELDRFELREFFKTLMEVSQTNPEILKGFNGKKFIMDQIEGFGFNADKYFENSEDKTQEKKDIRGRLLEDLAKPFKPAVQPARQNTDELAQVAGLNLGRETELETTA